jgi:amino acid permease
MGEVFGQWGRIALQASVIVNNVGVLIVYMIIIGTLKLSILPSNLTFEHFEMYR